MSKQGNFFQKPFWARPAPDALANTPVKTTTNITPPKETTMKPRTMALNTTADAAVHSEPAVRTGPVRSPFLTTKEAATYLRMSPRSIERLRVEGTGPVYKKCGTGKKSKVLYTYTDLDAWLGGSRRSTSDWDGG